jgi:hypothetical protein
MSLSLSPSVFLFVFLFWSLPLYLSALHFQVLKCLNLLPFLSMDALWQLLSSCGRETPLHLLNELYLLALLIKSHSSSGVPVQ